MVYFYPRSLHFISGAEGGIRIHLPAKSSNLLGNSQNLRIRFVFVPSSNFFLVSLILAILSGALS